MNAYFQVFNDNGLCSVKFVPATDDGCGIDKAELVEYLNSKNITYESKDLLDILNDLSSVRVLKSMTGFRFPENETARVLIAPDNMTVTLRLIPPFVGGQVMSEEEIMRELSARGIIEGIDTDIIKATMKSRRYCTDLLVAMGTPPKQGKDASIEYFFNTDPKARPTLNPDGSVDFFHLNLLNLCEKGDLLAKLTPAVQGTYGVNVKGEKIRPRDVRQLALKFGHNITLSEDKTEIYSDVSGHVNYIEGKVFVSNVYQVENVDNSCGNIEYAGSVLVNGNVCENFKVKAEGDIEVRGVVEGAMLEAGGNIIIVRGMNGMGKGSLKAGGNIVSKFLENAEVTANGYVDSESIMHSKVNAGTDIHVTGKRGFIAGGHVCAKSSISVKNLGSAMGADTIVEVGVDASLKQRALVLQKNIADINKQLETIKPVLEGARKKLELGIKMTPEQLQQIQKLAILNKEQSQKVEEYKQELNDALNSLDTENQGQVIVTGEVYQGTKIVIGDVSMVVKGGMQYCRFIKEAGDVKMAAI